MIASKTRITAARDLDDYLSRLPSANSCTFDQAFSPDGGKTGKRPSSSGRHA